MKTYTAKFRRDNPQLSNGGYYTTRTIKAKSKANAIKQAKKLENCPYGSMTLIELIEEEVNNKNNS